MTFYYILCYSITSIKEYRMTTKVNADTSGGLKLTSDTSGTLELQSAGNTKLTVNSSGASVTTMTASGVIKTDDTTAATSTTDGSLQTDGGLSVAGDAVVGDDLLLLSDGAIMKFGADSEIVLTHVADAGLRFSDSDQLQFGDGGDLKIYHDASNSYVEDAGTGVLVVKGSQVNINSAGDESMAAFVADGAATLYHNNVAKIATTATGVAVTGGVTGVTDINSGQVGGRRNLLINGAQQVDQRNGGAGVTPNSVYITDRWKMQSQAGGSGAQITSTIAGFTKSLKYTGSEDSSFLQLGQQIEYATYGHLAGSEITISFYAKANNTNSGSTALTVRTRSVTGVDGSALFAGSNSDTSVTISTTAARYTVSRTIPADSKGFSIEFALGAHVNTDGFEITGIQAELGTVTAFEYTDIGTEFTACSRYFQKSYTDVYTGLVGFGIAGAAGAFRERVNFNGYMRAGPTMAYTNLGTGWSAANINSCESHFTVELSKNTSDIRPNFQYTANADF